jgi:hypothetical protein
VEVKVGVKGAPRELTIDVTLTPAELAAAVKAVVVGEEALLVLADDKGRQLLVPSEKLAYVEIGEPVERRVGFGAM